jgi:hypothetical protein
MKLLNPSLLRPSINITNHLITLAIGDLTVHCYYYTSASSNLSTYFTSINLFSCGIRIIEIVDPKYGVKYEPN